ncbi:MAG: ferrous iron transporter B [Elusimicrobia bacterium]|nr:ferrous iron transporter B [Elusimicrobiota bacterium]
MSTWESETRRVVLAGQPNVGKSVLFNALTGKYVAVSNYPGTTVDVSRGVGEIGGGAAEFVDSPGIYSLAAHSDEERVTRSLLLAGPDAVVQVADMKDLPRALVLTLELLGLRIPLVLCLNMKDEALSRGCRVDVRRLSEILKIPVAETVAITREGLGELRSAVERACALSSSSGNRPPERPPSLPRAASAVFLRARREEAVAIAAEVFTAPGSSGVSGADRFLESLGRLCLRPWPGYLLAGAVLWGLYEFVGVLGAQTAVNFLEKTVFGSWVNPPLARAMEAIFPWVFVRDFFVGQYGVFTMALTYAFAIILPIVTTFFLALGILEDSGYLPRLSVLLNRFFKMVGLNGKAVFPMILGLGCGTMAVLTTRILDTRREKILATFLLALAVPCSAQLGVILGMTAGASGSVLLVWLLVMVGSLLGTGALASRILPGAAAHFILEIPPMRFPQWSNLFRKVGARLKWYLREVLPLFVYATAALFLLDAFGLLKDVERLASPFVSGTLGLPEEAAGAFLVGFFRRDYGAAGLYQMQRQGLLSLRQSAVALVAITLFMPCVAQWLMVVRERGMGAALAISGTVLMYAVAVSAALNQALLALGWR